MRIDWEEVHSGRKGGALRPFLAGGSAIYGLGLRLHRMVQDKREPDSLPGFVVSVGNLTVGGTGKTPAAAMIARWAQGLGYRPVVLSRGYGRRKGAGSIIVLDGRGPRPDPAGAGDEPCLLSRSAPGVPVVVSRKRYSAGLYAHAEFASNFFILDDGFQHRMLHRDLDLVLLDAGDPLGNGPLLPWGPLREPVWSLGRADALLLTRCGEDNDRPGEEVARRFPGKPLFKSRHAPVEAVFPGAGLNRHPSFLKGKRVVAFCGIARPRVFRRSLERLGAIVTRFVPFRDHHLFDHAELEALKSVKRDLKADFLITTEKDWVRLASMKEVEPWAGFLRIQLELIPDSSAFFSMIRAAAEHCGVAPGDRVRY
ncbi:MAG: tetraacyldisaccharide 4'-kinase [Desulfobacteraceae bacterium]